MALITLYFKFNFFLKNGIPIVIKTIPRIKPLKLKQQKPIVRRILPQRVRKRQDFYGIDNN